VNAYADWVDAIGDAENATAQARRARDRLLALQTWLTWQVRRRRVDAEDGAAALEDVAVALEVVQMTLTALRQERGRLTQDKPRY